MKRNHKIALTILASLGLLTLGTPAANAKSVNSINHVNSDQNVKVAHNQKSNNSELASKLTSEHQPINVKAQPNRNQKVITNKVKPHNGSNTEEIQKPAKRHNSSIKLTSKKTDLKNQPVKKSVDKSTLRNEHRKAIEQKLNHKKRSKKAKALSYDKILLPSKPLNDQDRQNISDMKKFVKIRKPYHYTEIGGNTRDLGGYPTADHKYQTKADRIIRSADLDGLSKLGLKALKKLHVTKIVDLRYQPSNNGISGHPDPNELHGKTLKGTQISYQRDPVYSYGEAHHFEGYMKKNGVHGEFYYYGAPSINETQAIKAYRRVFKDLLNNHQGAILYHCNLGRDRTGTTSALILSALGVSRNIIFHDYLLTDYYHYKYHRGNILPYAKQAGELAYFFSSINHKYGSVKNYLNQAIGLSNQNIKQLRSMYLVSNN